jgi:glycosyltransferase involved in cell wall biosynthesis
MSRVAFFMYGVNRLHGSGGAERFFSDFFERYINSESSQYKLYFIIDEKSVGSLNEIDKLKTNKNLLRFKVFSNRFKHLLEFAQLLKHIVIHKIDIIHIPLYDLSYLPLFELINKLPGWIKPKLVINIVDCCIAPALIDPKDPKHGAIKNVYTPLFNEANIDGYFCWNRSFEDYTIRNNVFKFKPRVINSITSRLCDISKYYPGAKEKHIVFAGRLNDSKHPEWLLKALFELKKQAPEVLEGWKVIICGEGVLREQLIQMVKDENMSDLIEFRIEGQMQNVLNFSKIYISCQDYDNFPSLSMAEAMAAGNAIVARNLGQTELFVRHGYNGLLAEQDNPSGIMNALKKLLSQPTLIEEMGAKSSYLIKTEHTYENFIAQIENFWSVLLKSA